MVRITAQSIIALVFLTSSALAAPQATTTAPAPAAATLDIPLSALEAAAVVDVPVVEEVTAPANGTSDLGKRTAPYTCGAGKPGNPALPDFVWIGGAEKACKAWFGTNLNTVHYLLKGSLRAAPVPLGAPYPTLTYRYHVNPVPCTSYPVYVQMTGNKCIAELKSIVAGCPNKAFGYNFGNPTGIWFEYYHS
ncbi:MAG: hypothetical protein M1839_005786 [Geoglossum umbratile]|nr:MAG: hypothetical protein M1839_005786 [Geoglossum umbratile]